ncbi:MAG TPA: uracil-DNA glycosylase [Thermodesulfovibrionales bacterium]|nr:uracil-DNA glycosylase [Thermodesulfovibrionales bacterium]
MSLTEDITTVLKFYEALGFEKLPLPVARKNKRPAVSKMPGADQGGQALAAPEIKEAALAAVREEIGDCQRCKLAKGRRTIVFGEGNPDADLMFIGEGPGKEEDLQGRPFVGDAGKLLDRLIEKMGFRREEVYIGNIVKCRPPMNRDPEEDEVGTCMQFIERQIGIIAPKVIVSLGRISAHTLTATSTPISRMRGTFYEFRGIPLMPTFHPAYLLRNPNAKWDVWNDMQKVLEKLMGEKK